MEKTGHVGVRFARVERICHCRAEDKYKHSEIRSNVTFIVVTRQETKERKRVELNAWRLGGKMAAR